MRPELNQIELIDRYLRKDGTPDELQAMSDQIAASEELQALMAQHELVLQTIRRNALRKEIISYKPKGGGGFKGKVQWAILTGIIVLGVITAIVASNYSNRFSEDENSNASLTEMLDNTRSFNPEVYDANPETHDTYNRPDRYYMDAKDSELNPWLPFKNQSFDLKAEEGGVFEGDEGVVVVVPENALIDNKGRTVKGSVEMELIEAIDLEDMICLLYTSPSPRDA